MNENHVIWLPFFYKLSFLSWRDVKTGGDTSATVVKNVNFGVTPLYECSLNLKLRFDSAHIVSSFLLVSFIIVIYATKTIKIYFELRRGKRSKGATEDPFYGGLVATLSL